MYLGIFRMRFIPLILGAVNLETEATSDTPPNLVAIIETISNATIINDLPNSLEEP